MGQSYMLMNFDKKEYVHPHTLGCGYTFGQIVHSDSVPYALMYLLHRSSSPRDPLGPMGGRWAGDRVAIVGEYDAAGEHDHALGSDGNAQNGWTDIGDALRAELRLHDCTPEKAVFEMRRKCGDPA